MKDSLMEEVGPGFCSQVNFVLKFRSDEVNDKTLFPTNVVFTTHDWHDTIDAVRSIVKVRWNSWKGLKDVSTYNAIVSW